ncbi:MAG: rhomboid family intramembrane serine protease [Gammaproteobacteria bacterium]|nr:rhomboid family intramembrane serine protease [Gammaproteobacteria bacterium]
MPILTLLICILCTFVYWQQRSIDQQYFQAIEKFCVQDLSRRELAWLHRVPGEGEGNRCAIILESIRDSEDANQTIDRLARLVKPIKLFTSVEANLEHVEKQLSDIYRKFERDVPEHLTSDLAYNPHDLDIVKMVTSTFSHGSAMHLAGNLLFFYIFAASVELVFGSLVFVLFITIATLGTSLAYSFAMAGIENALPTIGLSGVVMAAVAALGVMMPTVKIRCFFWFFLFFRIFRVPALLIAIWYVGWDVYEISQLDNNSYVNYVAHISGAAIGVLFGAYYLVFRSRLLEEMAV